MTGFATNAASCRDSLAALSLATPTVTDAFATELLARASAAAKASWVQIRECVSM